MMSFQQIQSINVVVEHIFKKLSQNLPSQNCQKFGFSNLVSFYRKRKFCCKSILNGLKRVKNTKLPTRPPPPSMTADAAANRFSQ